MSHESLKKSLEVLEYLQQKERYEARQRKDETDLENARSEIESLKTELKKKNDIIIDLNKKAHAKEIEIQQRAVTIAEYMVAERLPAAVDEGVHKEIEGYPLQCKDSTRTTINTGLRTLYADAFKRSWWAHLLLTPATSNSTEK